MIKTIVTVPSDILRKRTVPVADPTSSDIRSLLQDLKDSCVSAQGVGLAAPQIGSRHRVCVINYPQGAPYGLINPKVVWASRGTSTLEERCLSIPGVSVRLPRPKKVRVKALDEVGSPVEISAGDFLAKVLQHEIDHLNGRLITDYL